MVASQTFSVWAEISAFMTFLWTLDEKSQALLWRCSIEMSGSVGTAGHRRDLAIGPTIDIPCSIWSTRSLSIDLASFMNLFHRVIWKQEPSCKGAESSWPRKSRRRCGSFTNCKTRSVSGSNLTAWSSQKDISCCRWWLSQSGKRTATLSLQYCLIKKNSLNKETLFKQCFFAKIKA